MTHLKVAVNVSKLNVPNLIDRSNLFQLNMNTNITVFANCAAQLAIVATATNDLSTASDNAAATGQKKKDVVRDKKRFLIQQLLILGTLVQAVAKDDEAIVHLAGMDVKHTAVHIFAGFSARQGTTHGNVTLRVTAVAKTIYQWMYSLDNITWTTSGTSDTSKTLITNLQAGVYWFKVVFIDGKGSRESDPIHFAVN